MGKKVTRLYEQFQPEHYEVEFDVSPDDMSFSGAILLRGRKTGRPSQRITLHQKDLKFGKATLVKHDRKGDQFIEVSRVNTQNSLDEVRLHADQMLYPGNYTLTLEFEGDISRPMNGIYPCFFKHDGQDK